MGLECLTYTWPTPLLSPLHAFFVPPRRPYQPRGNPAHSTPAALQVPCKAQVSGACAAPPVARPCPAILS